MDRWVLCVYVCVCESGLSVSYLEGVLMHLCVCVCVCVCVCQSSCGSVVVLFLISLSTSQDPMGVSYLVGCVGGGRWLTDRERET